jgi:hypothetical protein
MTCQSSDTDLARAQFCLVPSHALPLDMYAPQDISFVPPGAGAMAGRFSAAFQAPPWNRRAMEYIAFFFLLTSAIVATSKKIGGSVFLFFSFQFLLHVFLFLGRILLQLLASAIPYLSSPC